MLNLILDTWLESVTHSDHHAATQKVLQQIADNWAGEEPLLMQLHDQHPENIVENVLEELAQAGWQKSQIKLHRWTPIGGLHPEHPNNQILRSHAAENHGAHVELHIARWPKKVHDDLPLPQVLLLSDTGRRPGRIESLKQALRRHKLNRIINNYERIAIDNNLSLGQDLGLTPHDERVVTIPQLQLSLNSLCTTTNKQRKRLAWVTPSQTVRSGATTYANNLVGELGKHYDVTMINEAPSTEHKDQRSTEWLLKNGYRFDRICYHIGNSVHYRTIQQCALKWEGAVVLHDFYLGNLQFDCQSDKKLAQKSINEECLRNLYFSHGFHAIHKAYKDEGLTLQAMRGYSINRQLIERSLGVIVHSCAAQEGLKERNYQTVIAQVPMMNERRQLPDRQTARRKLALDETTIQICSFGTVGKSKGSLEIFHAWSQLPRNLRDRTQLIFVGDNNNNGYSIELRAKIRSTSIKNQVQVIGWSEDTLYNTYLASCDLAVQLQTINSIEDSATIYDVICSGVPAVVNTKGSMRELPEGAVVTVADVFSQDELCRAMQTLIADRDGYYKRAQASRTELLEAHAPDKVATAYYHALELLYKSNKGSEQQVIQKLATRTRTNALWDSRIAAAIDGSFQKNCQQGQRQLLVDVTQVAENDLKTGIQRVVRALVLEWIRSFNDTVRIEPVKLSTKGGFWHYRYAREWTFQLLGCPLPGLKDDPIEVAAGDQMLLLDLNGGALVEAHKSDVYTQLKKKGVDITGIVYDILPILNRQFFPAETYDGHLRWLLAIAEASEKLVCISEAVADETEQFLGANLDPCAIPEIDWFHLGADISQSGASEGWHGMHDALEHQLECTTSFLMVGTIEPRKGHKQAIDAIKQLLDQGQSVTLVIVGKRGWMVDAVVKDLESNAYRDQGIHWLTGVSDEYLQHLYTRCDCLIAASEGEGFGLPLIEAAMQNLPIIARDIPVFQEVAGESAFYFRGKTPTELASAIQDWITAFKKDIHPRSEKMSWLSWEESAKQLLKHLGTTSHKNLINPKENLNQC